jgi:hypothetical protein
MQPIIIVIIIIYVILSVSFLIILLTGSCRNANYSDPDCVKNILKGVIQTENTLLIGGRKASCEMREKQDINDKLHLSLSEWVERDDTGQIIQDVNGKNIVYTVEPRVFWKGFMMSSSVCAEVWSLPRLDTISGTAGLSRRFYGLLILYSSMLCGGIVVSQILTFDVSHLLTSTLNSVMVGLGLIGAILLSFIKSTNDKETSGWNLHTLGSFLFFLFLPSSTAVYLPSGLGIAGTCNLLFNVTWLTLHITYVEKACGGCNNFFNGLYSFISEALLVWVTINLCFLNEIIDLI